ncbi:Krueppel-like factor 2 [Erythrolamprus reginae]|uniref:Krueppel-like factor 2 n=1 Tax=Erythrolamprus reginae TaxID=121349 RepID=UPI00396C6899
MGNKTPLMAGRDSPGPEDQGRPNSGASPPSDTAPRRRHISSGHAVGLRASLARFKWSPPPARPSTARPGSLFGLGDPESDIAACLASLASFQKVDSRPSSQDPHHPTCLPNGNGGIRIQRTAHFNTQTATHRCNYNGCRKTNKKSSHLKAHLKTHKDEKLYYCNWQGCGMKFSCCEEMTRHYENHTSHFLLQCHLCDQSFSRSDHLASHMKQHQ